MHMLLAHCHSLDRQRYAGTGVDVGSDALSVVPALCSWAVVGVSGGFVRTRCSLVTTLSYNSEQWVGW